MEALTDARIADAQNKNADDKKFDYLNSGSGKSISREDWDKMSDEEKSEKLHEKGTKEQASGETDDSHGTTRDNLGKEFLGDVTDSLVSIGGVNSDKDGYIDAKGQYHQRTCFVAGMLVHTANGTKPIEEIKIGDKVKSWDEETGEYVIGEVTELFRHRVSLLFEIRYTNGQLLETTWNHPFYIKGKGWTEAKDIHSGDSSLSATGALLEVASVTQKSVPETDVFNFEVADTHVYLVGDVGVVVHNYAWVSAAIGAAVAGSVETAVQVITDSQDDPIVRTKKFLAASVVGAVAGASGVGLVGVFRGAVTSIRTATVLANATTGTVGNAILAATGDYIDGKPINPKKVIIAGGIGGFTGATLGAAHANYLGSSRISPIGYEQSVKLPVGRLPLIYPIKNYVSTNVFTSFESASGLIAGITTESGNQVVNNNLFNNNRPRPTIQGTCGVNMSCN